MFPWSSWGYLTVFLICTDVMLWCQGKQYKLLHRKNVNEACASAQHQQILSPVQEPKPAVWQWTNQSSNLSFNLVENLFTGSLEKSAITWSSHCLWNNLIEYCIIVALGSFTGAFNVFLIPKEWTNILHVLLPLHFQPSAILKQIPLAEIRGPPL